MAVAADRIPTPWRTRLRQRPAAGGVEEGGAREALLTVEDVTVRFGGIAALAGIRLTMQAGEICGLIGPNGAGKTTLFNCLSRIYIPSHGTISFGGVDLSTVARHKIAGLGIGRTYQNLALFPKMTVSENIAVGGHSILRCGFLKHALGLRQVWREEQELATRVAEITEFLNLGAVVNSAVGALPFGVQKRVELGRALALSPRLLLLDEPAAGLNFEEIEALKVLIRTIRDDLGVTVLLVEHHMQLVMSISDHVVALNFGKTIADGKPAEVRAHPEVIRAYLGAEA